ncbi:MAG: TIGR02678 family protein [Acidobacteriota bacterium]|nr:TIGR02678 family protein [Acidobacteriota bacterium]
MKRESFHTVVQEETLREQRKAMRALLKRPLITAGGEGAEDFVLIRRHAAYLNRWLSRNAGWSLFVDSETARLRKLPVNLKDTTRGAAVKQPFNRRRYALFCLALAALGQGDRQTTLGRLFENILQLAAADSALADAGLRLDPNLRDHRRDLVTAVHLMMELGLLQQVDGDEQAYLGGRGDVLYSINRSALAWVLNVRRSPSTVESTELEERMAAITAEPQPDSPEGRNRRARLYLNRKLLDDPVLYYDRLSDEERNYLAVQRHKITTGIAEVTGLHPEIRREGIAMVDEGGELTDLDMPKEGTEGHITLLLAEFLSRDLKHGGAGPIGRITLQKELSRLVKEYGKYWRKDAREPEAVERLVNEAVYRLEALDLIEEHQDGIVPLPALARYAVDSPRISGLFDAEGDF